MSIFDRFMAVLDSSVTFGSPDILKTLFHTLLSRNVGEWRPTYIWFICDTAIFPSLRPCNSSNLTVKNLNVTEERKRPSRRWYQWNLHQNVKNVISYLPYFCLKNVLCFSIQFYFVRIISLSLYHHNPIDLI